MKHVLGWLIAILLIATGCSHAAPVVVPSVVLPSLSDSTLFVQVDPSRGGAIPYLSIMDGTNQSGNLINVSDYTGRALQASYYDGQWDGDCWPSLTATCVWGYNPTEAGDADERGSGGSLVSQSDTSIVTTTTPRQWDARQGFSNLTLQQTVTIIGEGTLRIDYQYTSHETRALGLMNRHEMPCVYLSPTLTLGAYVGADGLERPSVGLSDVQTGGEPWMAASNPLTGYTVAVYAPASDTHFSLDFGTQPGKETTLIQAWQSLILAPEQTATVTAWIVVGPSLDVVRQRIAHIG